MPQVEGISFFFGGLLQVHEKTGILLADDLVYPGESRLRSVDAATEGAVLELDDLLEPFVVLLVEVEVQDLDILELRGVVKAKTTLAVRVDQQSGIQSTLRLFDLIETLDDDGRQFLERDAQPLLLPDQSKEMLIAPA
jgi:hypothetical protein